MTSVSRREEDETCLVRVGGGGGVQTIYRLPSPCCRLNYHSIPSQGHTDIPSGRPVKLTMSPPLQSVPKKVLGPPSNNLGRRLLPTVVDEIASTDAGRIVCSFTKTKDPSDGFQDVTAREFARAINRCAWYILQSLGHAEGFPTITYMGPQDPMYAIIVLAAVKAGYKVLLTSPRNTLQAHLSLLEATGSHTFAMPPGFPLPIVKQILEARPMRVLDISSLEYWVADTFAGPTDHDRHFPYDKTYEQARLEPFVVLHTSGSTGVPKPIIQTHGTVSALDAFSALPDLGFEIAYPKTCEGKRIYMSFPLFHAAGIANFLYGPIYVGFTSVLGPYPPSAEIANAIHVHGNVQESLLPPTIVVELAKDPEHLKNLSRLDRITFGGGPLPRSIGDIVSTKTRLLNCLGSTECSGFPAQDCGEDWEYSKLSPCFGHEYRHVSGDLYEQVIVRRPELEAYQGVFGTFPDLHEWPMKDLYSPHPTREDCWLYRGRTDDIIVFSTGEKLNPLDMEGIICAHPAVNAALINGIGQFQSTLLVEAAQPPQNEEEEAKLVEEIWSTVQDANTASPSHARIHRDMIMFTSVDKPFLRAGKGTVQRRLTLELYEREFDGLYTAHERKLNEVGNNAHTNGVSANGHRSTISVQAAVEDIISTSTDIRIPHLDPNADLFGLGLDSLQVTVITRHINDYLSSRGIQASATTRTVYSNPTLSGLVTTVSFLADESQPTDESKTISDTDKMEKVYQEAVAELPISGRRAEPRGQGSLTVLLTGGTGSLGSYVLDSLLSDDRYSRIYCLNRGPDSLDRQIQAQTSRGLQELPTSKVTCLDGDITRPYFGLAKDVFARIINEVTDVIHSAWQVDFNLAVESFQSHISGVRRLVDFSAHSRFGAHIFFISSVSAVSGLESSVAETTFQDWNVPLAMGYGQSKFIAERILHTAAVEARVSSTICRIGQIAGPTTSTGMWPKREWLPSLIISSKALGVLPQSLGHNNRLDWVPVDVVGKTITEMVAQGAPARGGDHISTYHIANPGRSTWTDLVDTVAHRLGGEIKVVTLEAWLEALHGSLERGEDPQGVPAVKLYDFFVDLGASSKELTTLDTARAAEVSKTLRALGPVQDEWMVNWMKQWGL